ncbi:secreted RxLR effector protein 161-like [Bidens hawaiensis]|uniref:secreted RxLR effector protein 161-like n=1 Tax=Bidens hawaiensis TaxID=980011 RepID=UPI00404A3AB2
MYLTASRPDIMLPICKCVRYQSDPKESHLTAVKRIIRYLNGKPRLGLWYPTNSSLVLHAYTDSDYVGCNLERKSTIGGCQILGDRLISWQCKKRVTLSTSTVEAEYISSSSCCSQVIWNQYQLLDYGLKFFNTTIKCDNDAVVCIEQVPSDNNFANLFTKAFDRARFLYLVESLGMICFA